MFYTPKGSMVEIKVFQEPKQLNTGKTGPQVRISKDLTAQAKIPAVLCDKDGRFLRNLNALDKSNNILEVQEDGTVVGAFHHWGFGRNKTTGEQFELLQRFRVEKVV